MMTDLLTLGFPLGVGLLIGAVYFGGLWWTVKRGLSSPNPALWFLGSQLVRTSITVAGFYAVSNGRWERLLACLLGFALARFIVMRLSRAESALASIAPEPNHAP